MFSRGTTTAKTPWPVWSALSESVAQSNKGSGYYGTGDYAHYVPGMSQYYPASRFPHNQGEAESGIEPPPSQTNNYAHQRNLFYVKANDQNQQPQRQQQRRRQLPLNKHYIPVPHYHPQLHVGNRQAGPIGQQLFNFPRPISK